MKNTSKGNTRKTRAKRIFALVLTLVVAMGTLAGCLMQDDDEEDGSQQEATVSQVIKIAALNGPTGMGMAPLVAETDKYEITVYQAPDEVLAKVIKGEVDVAAVPSNVASVLYNKTEGNIQATAIQTGGTLYLMQNPAEGEEALVCENVEDLTKLKGCTIYGSGQGGIPEYVLRQMLTNAGLDPDKDVTIQWMANHSDSASSMMTNPGSVGLIPEPFRTTVSAKNDALVTISDLNALWNEAYDNDLPMGVLVAQKSFLEERFADWEILKADMAEAATWINENAAEAAPVIVEAGIGNDAAIVETAIPNCNIVFITGAEMKAALGNLYNILAEVQPKAIGGKLPDEGFYLQ